MSERHPSGRFRFRRLAELSSVAMAVLMLSAGVAHADDNGFPLEDGQTVVPGVTITRTNETANVLPSLASSESRSVYVSGIVTADVTRAVPPGCPAVFPFNYQCAYNGPADTHNPAFGATTDSSTHFSSQLNTGYLVGCQVDIAGNAISVGGTVSASLATGFGASGSISLNIGPGDVKFVQIGIKDIIASGLYSFQYDGTDIVINGCGGRAQARAYTTVEIVGNDYAKYSLYGQPFDIP
jgi:hypothetical protein